jgi:hypothetical protein
MFLAACGSDDGAGPGGGGGKGGGAGGTAGASGTAGGGGTAGAGGTMGRGGSSGAGGATAGSGGGAGSGGAGATAGTGGSGGAGGATAGAGGTAGAAGARGGSGGTAGATAGSGGTAGGGGTGGTAGAGGSSSGLRLEYQNSSSTTTMFSVRLTNDGPSTPLIGAIKVRYYFRDDSTNRDATPMVLEAKWNIASPSTTVDLRMNPGCSVVTTFATAPQNSYFDVGCGLSSPMLVGDTITMSLANSPAAQIASNDYSYADTAGAFVANTRMLIMLNGVVVSGTGP